LAIVVGYLLGVVALGLWIGRRQKDMADYLLGDRNLPLWLVLLSIVATETSTATFLSVPGLAFKEGGNLEFLQLALGYILGRYLVVWLLLPQYFRGQLFTAYQVLHQRFGGATRQAASLLFIVTRSLADGLRLFLAAIALRAILFPNQTSTPGELDLYLSLSVVLMGVATIVYTFVGGMKAVVWTDAIQFFIYILGALLAGAIIVDRLPDGWDGLLAYGEATNRLQLFDFRFDLTKNYTFWSGLFGGAFFSLGSHGADQLMVQRYLSARSQLQAGRALWLSGWIVLAQFTLFLMLGVGLAAFYQDRTFAPDEAFVNFIVHEMPVGVVGITLAAVFAAAMSTLSSSLNSSAAAAVNDFYLPLVRPNASPEHALRITRGLTVFFGLVQISVGVAGQLLAKSVVENVLAIAAFTTGVVLGLFFLGIFTRRVGQQAALVALVVGLAALCGVKFALPLKWPGAVLAWPWYVLVGSLGTFAMGVLASYVIPDDDQPPKTAAPM
jgi:SSS family transporter